VSDFFTVDWGKKKASINLSCDINQLYFWHGYCCILTSKEELNKSINFKYRELRREKMKRCLKILVLATVAVFLVAGSVWATPIVEISGTGGTTFQVSDSDGDGIVSWIGTFGVFDLTLTMGVTKPQDGSSAVPMMHLSGAATTNSDNGTLTIKFTEDGFGPLNSSITGFISSMNGSGGTQSLDVYYDTGNQSFGTGTQFADIDVLDTSEIFNNVPNSSPFSLTMVSTIILNNGTGSFDDTVVAPVPEPATILLMGFGLLGLGIFGRKKLANKTI